MKELRNLLANCINPLDFTSPNIHSINVKLNTQDVIFNFDLPDDNGNQRLLSIEIVYSPEGIEDCPSCGKGFYD